MKTRCHYNEAFVQQFYSTVVFDENEDISFTWMTGSQRMDSSFHEFADILGYPFAAASVPSGIRVHLRGEKPDRNKLEPLYDDVSKVGQVAGLSPLYNILLRMFRENISPSGGNNDALRGGLVELMFLAYRCSINENLHANFKLDVMHYIFEDMYEAVMKKKCPPYAPYIMMLIKTKLGYEEIQDENSDI